MSLENLPVEFHKRFGGECNIFRAPGRVNLIGEHTDYNDGYVMPVAIGFDTFVACAETDSGKLVVQSLQHPESASFAVREAEPHPFHNWTDYVRGVLIQLEREGCVLRGANLLIDGHVPIGSGLRSRQPWRCLTPRTIEWTTPKSQSSASALRMSLWVLAAASWINLHR